MKKAELGFSINAIVILILTITMLGLGLAFLRNLIQPEFNPDTDVCLDTNAIVAQVGCIMHEIQSYTMYNSKFEFTEEMEKIIKKECAELFSCESFRPKDKCELCSDKGDCSKEVEERICVCDEYEKIISLYPEFYEYPNKTLERWGLNKTPSGTPYRIENTNDCIKSHLPPTPIKIDLTKEKCVEWTNESVTYIKNMGHIDCSKHGLKEYLVSNQDMYDKYCCLKSIPLTECEKGNPDFVLDWKVYCGGIESDLPDDWQERNGTMNLKTPCNMMSYSSQGNDIPVEFKQICRKKSILDYSCAGLKKAIILDIPIYDKSKEECIRLKFKTCYYKQYNLSYIYDIAISKGCDI